MADTIENSGGAAEPAIQEAVCVHTEKIFDSCKDRDCLDDMRVYLTENSQNALTTAAGLRAKHAELLYVDTAVQSVQFNRGFYSVDLSFYYKITGEIAGFGAAAPQITGLGYYTKRILLYGSDSGAKVFSSDAPLSTASSVSTSAGKLPIAVVEAVDPLMLDLRLVESADPGEGDAVFPVPDVIADAFDSPLVLSGGTRRVYATIGQFSIVRLERDTQLLIPAYDYCVPSKECADTAPDDPCTLFNRIDFPVDEFFPPDTVSGFSETYRGAIEDLRE
ncbi:MAG: hypothetical protein II583_01580 [Oscillospiraceae bacterium]|nr:hypothetical protein [Oscillospiraceae bacterium]